MAAVFRPPWLEAVAAEPGVSATTIPDALARYAAALDRSPIWAGSVSGRDRLGFGTDPAQIAET